MVRLYGVIVFVKTYDWFMQDFFFFLKTYDWFIHDCFPESISTDSNGSFWSIKHMKYKRCSNHEWTPVTKFQCTPFCCYCCSFVNFFFLGNFNCII